jgi:hypothetical protein
MLLFAVLAFAWGDILFGMCDSAPYRAIARADKDRDTAAFSALQVLPAWLQSFGDFNAVTGVYSSPTSRTSLMNALVL